MRLLANNHEQDNMVIDVDAMVESHRLEVVVQSLPGLQREALDDVQDAEALLRLRSVTEIALERWRGLYDDYR